MARETILVVEDDPDIAELIQYNLEREGFAVAMAGDGERGLTLASRSNPALILLDLMLPSINGLDVCRALRQAPNTRDVPLIMVTAKDDESDIDLGLGIGADDYVTKPFSPKQLIARIRAVLRRRAPVKVVQPDDAIQTGPIFIDNARHEVRVDGSLVSLTLTQFRLLRALATHPERVLTRDQLLDHITKGETVIVDRNVDVHIRSIRKKLGRHGDRIVTVRGVGYKCRE